MKSTDRGYRRLLWRRFIVDFQVRSTQISEEMGGSERRSCGTKSGQRHCDFLGLTIMKEENKIRLAR